MRNPLRQFGNLARRYLLSRLSLTPVRERLDLLVHQMQACRSSEDETVD